MKPFARITGASRRATALAGLVLVTCAPWPLPAAARSAATLFHDADLPLGEKLIRDNACSACHIRKVGGDGSAIYRPQGRINTPGRLRGMVEQCGLELKISLFPEEATSIAAVLNRDHYRFK